MKRKKKPRKRKTARITGIGITNDRLTSRGGLSLFVRYLDSIGIMPRIQELFGGMRKNGKGRSVEEIFKQMFCHFIDGTSRHLVHFDRIKGDRGYAGAIESRPEDMVSSHVIKRFFTRMVFPLTWLFRRMLGELFVWRLRLRKPTMIEVGIDTMVMDNDEAKKRHGVEATYKKVKGFQPLQMTWGRFVVDAVFRSGSKHSNYGDTVEQMIRRMVKLIRTNYRADIPIIIRMDSGFFDEHLFEVCEELAIGYIVSGRLYEDIKKYVAQTEYAAWKEYQNREQVWDYVEFMDKRGTWTKSRRAFYCRPRYEGVQLLLDFVRSDSILYTNIGVGERIDELLVKAGEPEAHTAEKIIESAHGRGRDELVHRALKDFGHEELPFERFAPNAAYYYTMLLAFFLFETFKADVTDDVIPTTAYATTLRRRLIDIAAKIVKTGRAVILKVSSVTWNTLHFDVLWQKCASPPRFA